MTPVFATFAVTCREGRNASTWQQRNPATAAMAAACRGTTAGRYECFLPAVFRGAQEQMEKQMKESLENMLKKK